MKKFLLISFLLTTIFTSQSCKEEEIPVTGDIYIYALGDMIEVGIYSIDVVDRINEYYFTPNLALQTLNVYKSATVEGLLPGNYIVAELYTTGNYDAVQVQAGKEARASLN